MAYTHHSKFAKILRRMWTACESSCSQPEHIRHAPFLCTGHVKSGLYSKANCLYIGWRIEKFLFSIWMEYMDQVPQQMLRLQMAPLGNFSEVLGWRDTQGTVNFSSKIVWAFIPTKPGCGKSWHSEKIYNCLALAHASLAEGLESINPIFSKSLTFRPPCPHKSLLWLL